MRASGLSLFLETTTCAVSFLEESRKEGLRGDKTTALWRQDFKRADVGQTAGCN
jgi:hypothetical protein